ncbi:MAG TPA: hypothetical protein PLN21_04455 [Gemmatales bacterium]|nr:hypothetical protein [Gemmatales bacterium]
MFLSSKQRNPRRGVILLVVLALITLFASIGVAFVYFAEGEATKAQDQKAGETVKLPDADLMFNYVLRQLVFPTTNNTSALYTQSLLENMYGRTSSTNPAFPLGNVAQNVVPFNGTGFRANFDPASDAIEAIPQVGPASGQDNLYRRNMQFRFYDESKHGSLNPSYTYPDHKNPYLGGVTANYRQPDYTTHLPSGITHGPVAIARSWAREMKFRIAVRDTATLATVGYQEVILNPYSNTVFPLTGVRHQDFWKNLPFLDMGALPGLAPGLEYVPNLSIQCTPTGATAHLMVNAAGMANHTLRPKPNNTTGFNAGFPPPGDNGGDVKNLPPEVKTLVGFDAANNPVFANNDSYWMDVGFPAMQWSNNKKIKPMVAMFIMDNDGKVNLNTAGNFRAQDVALGQTYHSSAHGLSPAEINLTKLTEAFNIPLYGQPAITTATIRNELAALMGGYANAGSGPTVMRGRAGYTSLGDGNPTTAAATYPTAPAFAMYAPIFRTGSPYAPVNIDGTYDGINAAVYYAPSKSWQLSGEAPVVITDPLFLRFPYFKAPFVVDANGYYNGFASGTLNEYQRGGVNRSPLFLSPFASSQPGNNADSGLGAGSQRTFGPQNHEELYRTRDSGGDKFNGELRKLIPSSYTTAQQRWQQTLYSNDLSVPGISPWFDNTITDYAIPATGNNAGLTNGGAGSGQPMPTTAATTGDYFSNTNYSWRSIFANVAGTNVNSFNRLDLSRQLPDYPLPANNNTLLDLANPVVRAQYMIALQARQRMAKEIYNNLKMLMQPNNDSGYRYIAQLAVNIVDYIDNDDYPTWMEVSDITTATGAAKIVWGTELPRLLLNEVYVEAVNHPGDPMPMNMAQNDYDVNHWVELYNPLTNSSYPGTWAASAGASPNNLDSEARLNVGGTSVYRLVIAKNANSATTAIMRTNQGNTQGFPNDLTDMQTKFVYFPAGDTVLPSDANYGNGTTASNNGFYLVGPGTVGTPTPPESATTGPVVPATDPLNFPTPNLSDANMTQGERIARAGTPFTDTADNRSAILLQRLANPYLPHNPINDPLVMAPGETPTVPPTPYNPYITIDYVSNIVIQHAVRNNSGGPDASYQAVTDRRSYGKLQPYASMNEITAGTTVSGVWVDQRPDREYNTAGLQPLTAQPQHTFLRHNGVETDRSPGAPITPPNPQPNTGGISYSNTLRLPFDWLVHLDRAPTSPAELLHVSGFKPHELTQQFNRLTPVITATSSTPTLAPGTAVTVTAAAGFIGQDRGTPFSLRDNDLVYVTWLAPAGNQSEWALATAVNHVTNTFQTTTNVTAAGVTGVEVRLVIPFAHYAPWYRALQNVDVNSSSRLYRFLETAAVRNPGVDVGQFRFTSNIPTVSAGANTPNISAPLAPGSNNHSRWIQLDHGTITGGNVGLPNLTAAKWLSPPPNTNNATVISTNDALLHIRAGDSVFGGELNPIGPYNSTATYINPTSVTDTNYNVGDTVVINAGSASTIVPEQRATILEIDQDRNCIRVVLSVDSSVATTAITEPLTIDYTYVSGRQPGKININTMWDRETFWALADAQAMNCFYGPAGNRDLYVDNIFTRIQQQRQPQYYYGPRMVGHTGFFGSIPEDRPFHGMATGDIPRSQFISQQGIGNTFLSDRYQEQPSGSLPYPAPRSGDMTSPVGGDLGDVHRFTRTLFEIGNPGQDHPYRRFELLSKIWNNMTVRSNTFSVWMTIGFFEYDDTNGIGAELGQIQGKNTRYRFFAVIDRTTIDRWLQSWALHDTKAGINTLMDNNLFPNLDPRYATFPNLTAISTSYSATTSLTGNVNGMSMPQTWSVNLTSTNPFFSSDGTAGGRMVYVESNVGGEYAQIISQTNTTIDLRLTLNHSGAGVMTIRPLPVPPTVLHWTQMK